MRRGITREGKLDRSKVYPPHWGKPPAIQTRDITKLPYVFDLVVALSSIGLKKNVQTDRQSGCAVKKNMNSQSF